ncbi:unnamed protein product [Dovyalis caffra]|uniref:Uncharacterized protein n=1 Tax=Dovyalis caffra TaxID=77055 RepID=A0AAV1SD81_9ROSI|nr:unnamed protein product [Dovyalis caffra]
MSGEILQNSVVEHSDAVQVDIQCQVPTTVVEAILYAFWWGSGLWTQYCVIGA